MENYVRFNCQCEAFEQKQTLKKFSMRRLEQFSTKSNLEKFRFFSSFSLVMDFPENFIWRPQLTQTMFFFYVVVHHFGLIIHIIENLWVIDVCVRATCEGIRGKYDDILYDMRSWGDINIIITILLARNHREPSSLPALHFFLHSANKSSLRSKKKKVKEKQNCSLDSFKLSSWSFHEVSCTSCYSIIEMIWIFVSVHACMCPCAHMCPHSCDNNHNQNNNDNLWTDCN